MTKIPVLLSTHRSSDDKFKDFEAAVLAALKDREDVACITLPPIYDLNANDPTVEVLRAWSGDAILLSWHYPRAAYWILRALEVPGRMGDEKRQSPSISAEGTSSSQGEATWWCVDLKAHDVPKAATGAVLDLLPRLQASDDASVASFETALQAACEEYKTSPYGRWYPVIDFERCTDCLECLNFCLFGVYGVNENEGILIEQPDACRNGCPACSRICPVGAIMFPIHDDPAIAGDANQDPGDLKLDLSQIFGGMAPSTDDIARQERDKALQEAGRAEDTKQSAELDSLVDELDDMDL